MKHSENFSRSPAHNSVTATAFSSPASLLAFGFGAGLSPVAPGTMGSLLAVPFVFLIRSLNGSWFWVLLATLFLLGIYVCGTSSRKLGVHDHGGIVWDEMVGYWLTTALIPVHWPWLLAAFILFRCFDILKPWPISLLDKRVPGGFGIMIDDGVAALYAMALLALAQRALG